MIVFDYVIDVLLEHILFDFLQVCKQWMLQPQMLLFQEQRSQQVYLAFLNWQCPVIYVMDDNGLAITFGSRFILCFTRFNLGLKPMLRLDWCRWSWRSTWRSKCAGSWRKCSKSTRSILGLCKRATNACGWVCYIFASRFPSPCWLGVNTLQAECPLQHLYACKMNHENQKSPKWTWAVVNSCVSLDVTVLLQ